MSADPRTLVVARLSLRFLQFAMSLVVVVTLSYAFTAAHERSGATVTNHADVTFAALMGFLGTIYGLFYLVFVEILMLCMRPLLLCELAMDFAMALLLLIASIVLTTSQTLQHCRQDSSDSDSHSKPHCDAVVTGVVFCYLAMATFVAALALTCCTSYGNTMGGYDRALFGEDSPISIEYDPPLPAEADSPPRFATPAVKV